MSIKKVMLIFSILLGCFSLSYFFNAAPAAQISSNFPRSQFTSQGVVARIIELKLNFDEVKTNSEKSTVTAQINMPFDFNGSLFYRWRLGENVVLHEGSLQGEISSILKNEARELSIVVTGFSKEQNRHIRFEIYGVKNGHKIYGDALIASDLENTFENTVQNVEKIKASQ